MQITEVYYPPFTKTKKYKVIHNGKEYSCYRNSFKGNNVFTGNGQAENCKDITHTRLGMEIILACGKI
jgi:hypothetical protein